MKVFWAHEKYYFSDIPVSACVLVWEGNNLIGELDYRSLQNFAKLRKFHDKSYVELARLWMAS